MPFFYSIELSHVTLLVFFALPFAYYGFHAAYWYQPAKIRFLDFILSAISLVLCLFVLARLAFLIRFGGEGRDLIFLHLGPPLLALFAVWTGKRWGIGGGGLVAARTAALPSSSYAPQAVNDKVEKLSWDDLVINEDVKEELNSVIKLLKDPQTARKLGLTVPKGIVFNGPPGTGKTTIAKVIANTAGLAFFALRADEVVSKWVGESEKNLSQLFKTAEEHAPAVVFIDEIDSIGKRRSDQNATYADNLLNHLLQLIDGVIKVEGLYVIGATNRAELVDEALKRAGRLSRVIEIALPDHQSRERLFRLYLARTRIAAEVDVEYLARATDGNSPADIKEICDYAGMHAFRRQSKSGALRGRRARRFEVGVEDFVAALKEFKIEQEEVDDSLQSKKGPPSVAPLNEQIEKASWSDLVIDDHLREELQSVVALLQDPQAAKNYGIELPKGILLNGPPGTGKTTVARIIASTAGLSFFVLQLNEILSKWVGESERNLTRLFKAAAKHAPSVIFIDELDSIGKNRAEGNAQHADILLNHLLQLIDGVIKRDGIYVIGATNRADLVDPALKRGGRLNRVIEVPLPDFEARRAIFSMYLAKLKITDRVDYDVLAKVTEGKSAADIKSICNQAGLNAFKRETALGSKEYVVRASDIIEAVKEFVVPPGH